MNNLKPIKPTIVLLIFVLFSLLCWMGFVKEIIPSLEKRFCSNNTLTANIETQNNNLKNEYSSEKTEAPGMATEAGIISAVSKLDTKTQNIEAVWKSSIFQKDFFSVIDSRLTWFTISQVSSGQVVGGEKGWLFYFTSSEGDSIADYEGTNRFSEYELETAVKNAKVVQNYFEANSVEFAILVAPNKENVYFEYVPDKYRHSEESRTDILIDYLNENGINTVYSKDALLLEKNQYELYYKYDTHWNQLGAYVGFREVMNSWGFEVAGIDEMTVIERPLKDNYHTSAVDDLANSVGLLDVFDDEIEFEIFETELLASKDWEIISEDEQSSEKVSVFHNSRAENHKTVAIVGDSFRFAMIPAFRSKFETVYVFKKQTCTPEMLLEANPDYVLFEYVERYSDTILSINRFIPNND